MGYDVWETHRARGDCYFGSEGRNYHNDYIDDETDRTYHGQEFDESETHFVCPWHGWEYDIKTGQSIGDRRQFLRKYEVVERGDDVFVIA